MATVPVQCACGKSYDVPSEKAGKRFKCVACGAALTVPEAPAAPPAENPLPAPAPARKPPANRAEPRRAAREAAPKKSPMPLVLGGVVVVAIVGVAIFMMMKKGDTGGTPGGGSGTSNSATAANEKKPEAPKDPKETKRADYATRLAAADKDPSPVPRWLEVATFCLAEPKLEAEAKQIYQKVIAKDPDNAQAREALGFKKYDGDQAEQKGKWVTADQLAALVAEDTRVREEEAKRKAAEEARAKDPFIQAAKKREAEMRGMVERTNAIAKEEVAKLASDYVESDDIDKYKKSDADPAEFDYYYATKDVPPPYVLAIQKGGVRETKSLSMDFGELLSELHRAFYRRYAPYARLRNLNETPVPVWIFYSQKQYERWRRCGNGGPRTGTTRAFYSGTEKNNASGMLYLWLIDTTTEKGATADIILDIQDVVWHEGTHQLMDFNSPGRSFGLGNMPWTQEGFAEYVGVHRRVIDKSEPNGWRYFFGLPSVGRKAEMFSYGSFSQKTEPDEFIEASPSLRDVCHTEYPDFWAARAMGEMQATGAEAQKANRLVSATYAYGWALCHFLQHKTDENGKFKYRDQFHQWLNAELEKRASGDYFDKLFKLDSDEKWKAFELEFQNYVTLDIRRDVKDVAELRDRVFDKYMKQFEDACRKQ